MMPASDNSIGLTEMRKRFRTPLMIEWRRCLILMGPIYIGQIAQMLMATTDTIMAGRLGAVELAAVSLGNGLWVPCLLFSVGLIGALQPLLAHALGEGNIKAFKPLVIRGLTIVAILSALFMIFLRFSHIGLSWFDAEAQSAEIASDYLEALSWGIAPVFLLLLFRSVCEGMGKPIIMTYLYLGMAAINVPLNFIFMHGYFGSPAFGAVGCGFASSVSNWLGLLVFCVYISRTGVFQLKSQHLSTSKGLEPNAGLTHYGLWSLLRLGLPMALHLFFEGFTFAGLVLLIAPLGPVSVAANQIGLNIISVIFMLPLSLGLSLSIRVAYLQGARRYDLAKALARSTPVPILLMATSASALLLMTGEWIIRFYTKDTAVIELALDVLFWAALFQIADMAQVVWTCTLRGMHDTLPAFLIFVTGCWGIGLPLGFILARTDYLVPALGVEGFWMGLLVALIFVMMFLWWRLWVVSGRAKQ